MSLERSIKFAPAWDRRGESAGVHGVQIDFTLKNAVSAVTFELFTDWMLPKTLEWWKETGLGRGHRTQGGAMRLCRTVPQYEDQKPATDCPHLGTCYSDFGFSAPEFIFLPALIERGEEAMWEEMGKFLTPEEENHE